MIKENLKIVAQTTEPNPKEVMYWIDLKTDPQGSMIKYYANDSKRWLPLVKEASTDTSVIDEKIQKAIENFDVSNMLIARIESLEGNVNGINYELQDIIGSL